MLLEENCGRFCNFKSRNYYFFSFSCVKMWNKVGIFFLYFVKEKVVMFHFQPHIQKNWDHYFSLFFVLQKIFRITKERRKDGQKKLDLFKLRFIVSYISISVKIRENTFKEFTTNLFYIFCLLWGTIFLTWLCTEQYLYAFNCNKNFSR